MLHPRRNPRTTVFENSRNATFVVRGRKNLPRKILDGIPCRGSMTAELIGRAKASGNQKMRSFAAYIAGWSKKLKEDVKAIVSASGQAQKASDYFLGIKPDDTK